MRFSLCAAMAVAVIGLAVGCVRQVVENPLQSKTTLTVARAGGTVTLGWESEADKVYTVLYADSLRGNSPWQPLPNGERLQGTGKYMSFTDNAPQEANRYYRLQIFPTSAK